MSFLNPWLLLAATAVAVPIFLHLFQRRKSVRLSFPALRYLERMEREHAHEIRFRQILLLLLRTGALLLLVLAAARPLIPGPGSTHPPTAVALVIDNSMSSGLVDGDVRVLDRLEEVAERALDAAGPEDRFWVVRAGEPWAPATPSGPEEARRLVRATEVSAARGDLTAALRRAAELVGASELPAKEIHLVSDLQATAFDPEVEAAAGDVPVVAWRPDVAPPTNRALVELLVGSGLAPVEGQPAELHVRVSEGPQDADPVGVRAVLDGRIRAATSVPPGAVATLPLAASSAGWIVGTVEADPDALSLDDRRFFAFRARPPPRVEVVGSPGRFVEDALAVLAEADRLSLTGDGAAPEVRLSVAAAGLLEGRRPGAAVVIPPTDMTLLPALNVRLQTAGVPWRYEAGSATGAATMAGVELPPGLEGVDVRLWLELTPSGEPSSPSRILTEVAGDPWAVETATADGIPVLLLASPLEASATSLPVSAGLVRFLDWLAGGWTSAAGSGEEHLAGQPLPAPGGATHVVGPAGDTTAVDGTRTVMATSAVGHYRFLAGDSVLAWIALNPPATESDLRRLTPAELDRAVGGALTVASGEAEWDRAVFRERTGPEIWWPLVLLAALLLLVESRVAASGHRAEASDRPTPPHDPQVHGAT